MTAAIADLDAAHADARAAFAMVDSAEDRQVAFEFIDLLASRVEAYAREDNPDRRASIRRIREVESLTLSELAARTNITKSRAYQIAGSPTAPKESSNV